MLIGKKIVIVGAGIGGLAAACALARHGAAVRVLERAAAITEVGAGLQISPNGFAVLDALGLGAEVEAAAVRSRAVCLRDHRAGRRVLRLDLGRAGDARRFLFLHRADLIDVLARAAKDAGVTLETGREVLEAWETGDGLRMALGDGSSRTCGLAIGADGLQSRLRQVLNGKDTPFFTGQVAWRALAPAPAGMPAEVSVYMGPGRHLVCYPLRGGRLVNIVAVEERSDWAAEGWNHRDDPENLRRAFAGFAPEVRGLLAEVAEVHLWGLFRHPVAARWFGSHTALLGDAAHPTLPFLAQGANMALEDAFVLARCLSQWPQAEALAAYQQARRARCVRIVAAATANARNYHLRSPLLRGAAHTALRLGGALFPSAALRRFDWLYGFDATRD